MQQFHFPTSADLAKILQRPAADYSSLQATVTSIFNDVKLNGDAALVRLTEQFDKVSLSTLKISEAEISAAASQLSPELKKAIVAAASNIKKFHLSQLLNEVKIETTTGVTCWRESRGIERVGLYIPGGSAPLFSTVLMLGIPAQIAGCKEVTLCSPPSFNGSIHPAILFAAQTCGISSIFKVGGVQAIAAMTFGTENIQAVYKIFGPGNAYVTVAKQIAQQYSVAIDMPAGPSEVMVIADSTADAAFVAADLLSQAEHGHDSQVILLALNEQIMNETLCEIDRQIAMLTRKDVASKALENSKTILVKGIDEAIAIANQYAAEHLILSVADAENLLPKIINAGSVFLGNYTPESCGDYASGTNHTLPTNGFARAYSGVSVDSFVKKITVQKITQVGLENIAPTVIEMAIAENLDAHANAVRIRLKKSAKLKLL